MKTYKYILIAALMCLLLSACNGGDSGSSDSPQEITTVPVTTLSIESSEVNSCVRVGREETFSYTDKNENTVSVVYRIPALTFDTPDAQKINNEIANEYNEAFSAAFEAASAKKSPEYSGIDYNAYVNDDIVSLVITEESSGHRLSYRVYNYNRSTGKQLDNEGLLAYLQRDADETYKELQSALEEDYLAKFKEEKFPDDYYYQLDLTISDEAVRRSQMFLNADAELYAVCVEYAGVGDGEYSVLISLAT